MINLILALLISSCSLLKKEESFVDEMKKNPRALVGEIPVSSRDEALSIIKTRHHYLNLLFEQTYDPHHGVPKWMDECLKVNKIGMVEVKPDQINLISELYLDPGYIEGHCHDRRYTWKSSAIYLYCEKLNKIYDIRVRHDPELKINARNLCQ